jgi:hypothetical protein
MTDSVKFEPRMWIEVILCRAAGPQFAENSKHGSAETQEMRDNQGK